MKEDIINGQTFIRNDNIAELEQRVQALEDDNQLLKAQFKQLLLTLGEYDGK